MWAKIIGWPYSISTNGSVRRDDTGNILTPMMCGPARSKYAVVALCYKGNGQRFRVHILVLTYFVGLRPIGMLGLHRDDNKGNNDLSNLYWGTPKQNAIDDANNNRTLSVEAVRDIRRRRHAGIKGAVLAKEYGISQQFICDIYKGRSHAYDIP